MEHQEMVAILKEKQGELSLRQFAQEIGLSAAYLSDVFKGNRQAGRRLLRMFGMTKKVTVKVDYRRMTSAEKARNNGKK